MSEAEQLLKLTEPQMTYMLLLFLRVTGLFVLSPILGRNNVPTTAKVGLSLLLSYIFLAAYPVSSAPAVSSANLLAYVLLCGKELLVGLVMGYMTTLFFDVAVMAGQIMDVQIGFGMSQIFDPAMGTSVSLVGDFLNYGLLLYFLAVGGHLTLIKILYFSFEKIPVGQVVLSTDIVTVCINAFGMAVSMAVSLALPVLAAEVILEIIMGIMIRSVPQLNIFVVGLSVKILVGLFALALTIPFFTAYGDKIFESLFTFVQAVMERMIRAA